VKRLFTLTAILLTLSVILAAPAAFAAGEVNECAEEPFLAALNNGGLVELNCSGIIKLSDEISITHDTIIDASGQDVQITNDVGTRIFQILDEEQRVTIIHVTFTGGLARTSGGGAILNRGFLTVEASRFVDNHVETGIGGAIHNDGGTLTIRDTEFTSNVAESGGSGGAIANSNAGVLIIEGGSFNSNIATSTTNGRGGAIYGISGKGTITITGTEFNDNVAHGSTEGGGAIYDDGPSEIIIEGATFSYNSAPNANGGAIYNKGATSTTSVRDSVFSNNSAPNGHGGAIYAASGSEIAIGRSSFDSNFADTGGALHIGGSANTIIVISQNTFKANTATHENLQTSEGGGAISNEGHLTITRSTFEGNLALDGSGGAIVNHEQAYIVNSTFSQNEAMDGGAFSATDGSSLKISHSTIVDNRASTPARGAGIDSGESVSVAVQVKNSIVASSLMGQNCHSLSLSAFGTNFDTDGSCSGFQQFSLDELNLADLTDNRGRTESIALNSRSVAVDAAEDCTDLNNEVVEVDQRGVPRTHGAACDVGAYERIDNPSDLSIRNINPEMTINVEGEYTLPYTCGERYEEGEESSHHFSYDTEIEFYLPELDKFLGIFPRPRQTVSFIENLEITESEFAVPMPGGPIGVMAELRSGESMTLSCADLIAMPTQVDGMGNLVQSLNEVIESGDFFRGQLIIQSSMTDLRIYVTEKVTKTEIVPEDSIFPAADPEFIEQREPVYPEYVDYEADVSLRLVSERNEINSAEVVTPQTKTQLNVLTENFNNRAIGFRAQSASTSQVGVEIYSLQGKRVFSERTSGSKLMWRMRDNSGNLVANGVYLYVVTAVDQFGVITHSGVKKLLVLR